MSEKPVDKYRIASITVLVFSAILEMVCLYFIMDDLSYRGEKFDGLAAALMTIPAIVLGAGITLQVLYLYLGRKWLFWLGSVPLIMIGSLTLVWLSGW